jgi:hypothetical protein
MSNEEEEISNNILEIRVYLIGDYYVGKKSIVKRFRTLNASKTSGDTPTIKKKEEKNKTNDDENDEDNKEEEKKELTQEQKDFLKKEEIRQNLMKITKVFTLGQKSIYFNFYPCLEAIPLKSNYNYDDEDEDYEFEKKYKITLKPTQKELEEYILNNSKYKGNIENFFLFVYDLSDFTSFKKLQIYFEQLNKHFKLNENNYYYSLIGNKLDQKRNLNDEDKKSLNDFISQNNMKYYEISTLMFYNFELFFENLFSGIFANFFADVEEYDKKINKILSSRSNFSKSERTTFKQNETPGPDTYDANVYQYPYNREEFLRTFNTKDGGRFNKKIFINKIGPIFNYKKKLNNNNFDENNNYNLSKEKKESKKYNQTVTNIYKELQHKKAIKESLQLNCDFPGYSLGIKDQKMNLNLKNSRREKIQDINNKLSEAFEESTFKLNSLPNKKLIKDKDYYDKCLSIKQEYNKNRIEDMKSLESEFMEKQKENLKNNEISQNNRIKRIKERQDKYNKISKDLEVIRSHSQQKKILPTISEPKLKLDTNYKFYDIRQKYDNTKGFTLGPKWKKFEKKIDYPQYATILDDFEKILLKNSKNNNKNLTYAERFIPLKINEPGDLTEFNEKLKQYEINKKNYRLNNTTTFFSDRQNLKERVQNNKERLKDKREEQLNNIIQTQFELTGENYLIPNINYSQVEERAPQFSITGKNLEKVSIFKKYNNESNLFNDLSDDKKRLENPNIAAVRPRLPVFSFGKGERFPNMYKFKDNDNDDKSGSEDKNNYNDLFVDGNFSYNDKQSFLKTQNFMGSSPKGDNVKKYEGPGYYLLKGFADEIIEKGRKINEAHIRMEKLKQEEEKKKLEKSMEKEQKNNDIENNNNNI